jgi:hypothetical protein
MPKKIKAYLTIDDLENECYLKDENDLIYYIRGYFAKLAFNYKQMTITQIKSDLEDLKVVFEFMDKMREKRRVYKNE